MAFSKRVTTCNKRSSQKDNIKMVLTIIQQSDVDWRVLTKDMDLRLTVVSTVMNFRVPQTTGNSFSSGEITNCKQGGLLQETVNFSCEEGSAYRRRYNFLFSKPLILFLGFIQPPMCTRGAFPVVKRLGRKAFHSPPSNAQIMNLLPLSLMPS